MPRSLPVAAILLCSLVAQLAGCAAPGPSPATSAGDGGRVREISPDLRVEELRPGVWLHTSWLTYPGGVRVPSNGLLVRDGGSLLLIDTAWGEQETEQLLQWAHSALGAPIGRAILTHSHHDRSAGTAALRRRGVPVLAHPLTRRLAAEQGQPIPDTLAGLAAAGSSTALGGVEVFYPGRGHTPDNLMVWIPAAGVLFGGCAVREAAATTLGNTAHADVRAWPRSMERALARYGSAALVVPGHGSPGGAELLEHTRALAAP